MAVVSYRTGLKDINLQNLKMGQSQDWGLYSQEVSKPH